MYSKLSIDLTVFLNSDFNKKFAMKKPSFLSVAKKHSFVKYLHILV